MRQLLSSREIDLSDDATLELFAEFESEFKKSEYIAILAGVVNFLPHPSPPREFGEGVRNSQMMR